MTHILHTTVRSAAKSQQERMLQQNLAQTNCILITSLPVWGHIFARERAWYIGL
jgi:hypothetical protein